MKDKYLRQNGFTLVEMTIVIVLVALLIGGLLIPLSAQRDIQSASETQKRLSEIREALFGFAVINKRLPCPSTATDPTSANYGIEDAACNDNEGYLPWKSLGVQATDAWGVARSASTDPFIGFWRYRVDNAFKVNFNLGTTPSSGLPTGLQIQDAAGNALTGSAPNSPIVIIYSTGPDRTPNGQNVDTDASATTDPIYQTGEPSPTFDDIILWISRPILFNRMISSGTLPGSS